MQSHDASADVRIGPRAGSSDGNEIAQDRDARAEASVEDAALDRIDPLPSLARTQLDEAGLGLDAVVLRSTEEEVRPTIQVDIPSARNGRPQKVARIGFFELVDELSGGKRQHLHRAGAQTRDPQQQVVDAIAVHVPRRSEGGTESLTVDTALRLKQLRPGLAAVDTDPSRVARLGSARTRAADREVRAAILVDVAHSHDLLTPVLEDRAVAKSAQFATVLARIQKGRPRHPTVGAVARSSHQHVRNAVAVRIPDARHGVSEADRLARADPAAEQGAIPPGAQLDLPLVEAGRIVERHAEQEVVEAIRVHVPAALTLPPIRSPEFCPG
jgi:hypothetical protein